MKYKHIKHFSDFLTTNQEENTYTLKNPKSFEELNYSGTFRWEACRKYNLNIFINKIINGKFFIISDIKKHPVCLIDIIDKKIIDFDNKEYKNLDYYKYLKMYPDIYNCLMKFP